MRLLLCGVALSWCALGVPFAPMAEAACIDAGRLAAPSELVEGEVSGPLSRDRRGRMVAPVTVNGEGPFRFIVDTGANRSVLARAVAERLGLIHVGEGEVHSVQGVSVAPLVSVDTLRYGDLALPSAAMPMLEGAVLAGAHGLLGVDGMRGRRLRMDFDRRCIEITPSGAANRLHGWSTVQGELRFGHLVVVPGEIRGRTISILIDTGSDTSLANPALREHLRGVVRSGTDPEAARRAFTAGDPVDLGAAILVPRLEIGDVIVGNMVAYVGDYHIFRLWDLQDEPTLLVGMDVLSQSAALAIDYERATVHFRLRRGRLPLAARVNPLPQRR